MASCSFDGTSRPLKLSLSNRGVWLRCLDPYSYDNRLCADTLRLKLIHHVQRRRARQIPIRCIDRQETVSLL